MIGFLVRRLVNYAALCLVATFAAFSLASLAFSPLDALKLRNPPAPQSTIDAKTAELYLDQPIPQRFLTWLGGVFQGDFGRTIADQPITDELLRRAGVSLRLFLLGITLGIIIGVLVGVVSAIRQYKISDYLATTFSFVVLSTPVFVIATILKAGAQSVNDTLLGGYQFFIVQGESGDASGGFGDVVLDRLQHIIVPTLAIVLTQVAYYSRYQRSAMLDVLGSDFLRTAQAKGLTRRRALFKHGLRTALIPMATLFAFGFGLLITGGIFTEKIFGWYGMGDWLVTGIQKQDTNIVATVTLFIAVCVLLAGWLADVFYAVLDPRVRI
ncbi:ABC transporter permease [Amycolatopsis panacis]|uniref:ABC transporter permease n=1 Tax=Amycolatopsis panacis TaxID=2340917 RepID=A0A419I485_9PSEU|nr:ABC transporter permease [Amycolatopsis panacis]RJQ85204.1 ABC transporter permease [Amycolatopsis panacis]